MTGTRRIIQIGFLLLTVIGVFVMRGNAERWCPFGGAAVLVSALLLRRAFCGYLCPVGAIPELLQAGARRVGIRPLRVPYVLDRALALLKYAVLVIVLYFTWRTAELMFRGFDPCYALLSRHGEDITFWAYVVAGGIAVGSLFIVMPFCRWFCPLAAVFHPCSRFGLARIKRDGDACNGCELCSKACPMGIRVAEAEQVTAARCISCLSCVEQCPSKKKRALSWGPPAALGGSWSQGVLITIMLLCVTAAVIGSYTWPVPSFVQQRGEAPAEVAVIEMEITNLTCRGRGTLLWYFLDRDDLFAVGGYLRLEAWPAPGPAKVLVSYDPSRADEKGIKQAITEPYFDPVGNRWRSSPFEITGYDPLLMGETISGDGRDGQRESRQAEAQAA
ncbi:MAG: 4Fe-4S binding protein [Planctomycetota bacterium]|jgi:ferredoxin